MQLYDFFKETYVPVCGQKEPFVGKYLQQPYNPDQSI